VTDITYRELRAGITEAVTSVGNGLTYSKKVLLLEEAPDPLLGRKLFTVDWPQDRNTEKTRGYPRLRMGPRVLLRMAHRVDLDNQVATQDTRDDDAQATMASLADYSYEPIGKIRLKYESGQRITHSSAEWLFTDLYFDCEFDLSLVREQ
jgi:hypothetical protein